MNPTHIERYADPELLEPRLLFDGVVGTSLPPVSPDLNAAVVVGAQAGSSVRAEQDAHSDFEVWRMGALGWELVREDGVSDAPGAGAEDEVEWCSYMGRMSQPSGRCSAA